VATAVDERRRQPATGRGQSFNAAWTVRDSVVKTLDPYDSADPYDPYAPEGAGRADRESRPAEAGGPALEVGDMVDHYQLLQRLGAGAMAEVFLARDTRLGRRVALKLIHGHLLDSARRVEQLLAEARTTAQFSHPNIVSIFAVGQALGRPYLALEYLEGQTLRQRLERERPSLQQALRWGGEIAAALVAAHERQVQHRDLKPDNVLLGRDGKLRVLDFGIAKSLATSKPPTTLPGQALDGTLHGLKGTPAYMAPEQWRERPITPAADVWALGLMLWEMLAGAHPFLAAGEQLTPAALTHLGARVASPERAPALDGPLPRGLIELVADCLDKDVAARPSAAEVYERLQGELQAATGDLGRASADPQRCPFPGLLPFSSKRSRYFVGRERELSAALERLREAPVLPIVGSAGAGKSSFLRAGLIPRLREQRHWVVIALRPGPRPFATLAPRLLAAEGYQVEGPTRPPSDQLAALEADLMATPGRLAQELRRVADEHRAGVLLTVDQTEDLFTVAPPEQAAAFLRALLGAAKLDDPLRVVFCLREDFLHRLPASPAAQRALAQLLVLGPPRPAELETILVRPLALAGYRYEDPAMVEEMLAQASSAATSLPLISFAISELWQRRDGERRLLERSAYEAIGGLDGALARHADDVLDRLPPEDQQRARDLLLRLVSAERRRLSVPRETLLDGLSDEAAGVLERLCEARLLTVRRGARGEAAPIELCHDALVTRWQRLRLWVEQSHDDLRLLAELRQAAELWQRRGRVAAEVWQGQPLRDALACLERWPDAASGSVGEFITIARRRADRALRQRRAWTTAGFALTALVVVASLLVALAFARRERAAERLRRRADAQRRLALAQRARAERTAARAAWARGDQVLARAQLRSALETADSPAGRALLLRLARHPLRWRRELGAFLYDVAFSPRGGVAAASQDGGVYLFDQPGGRLGRVLRDHRDQVFSLAYAPDGATLAAGAWDGKLRIWSVADGRQLLALRAHRGAIWDVAFTADGRRLISAGADGTLALTDAASGRVIGRLSGHRGAVARLAIAPPGLPAVGGERGVIVASGGYDGTVRLWSLAQRRQLLSRRSHGKKLVAALAFDGSGERLASGGFDGRVVIHDAKTLRPKRAFVADPVGVLNVGFAGSHRLVSSGLDAVIRLWDARSGDPRGALHGHSGPVDGLAVSADGKQLASASRDRSVRLWRLGSDASTATPGDGEGHGGAVYGVALDPARRRLASASTDGTVRLWSFSGDSPLPPLRRHHGQVYAVAFSPDGTLLASAGRDRSIRLWQLPGGRQRRLLVAHRATVRSLDFSADGSQLASASEDGTVRLWRVSDGTLLKTRSDHRLRVHVVRFAPGGALWASGGWDGVLRLWDRRGEPRGALRGHRGTIRAISWSADGKTVYSGGDDGTVRRWTLRGARGDATATQLWPPGGAASKASKANKANKGRRRLRASARIYALATVEGDRLAVARSDGQLRLLSTTGSAKEARLLGRHLGEINALAYDPGRRLLASAGDDRTVRLWHLGRGGPRWTAPPLLRTSGGAWLARGGRWRRLGDAPTVPQTRWAKAAARATRVATAGEGLCVLRRERSGVWLERWQRDNDRLRWRRRLATTPRALAVTQDSCLALVGDELRALTGATTSQTVLRRATLLSRDSEGILAAGAGAQGRPMIMAIDGRTLKRTELAPAPAGLTAVLRAPRYRVLGFRDGNLELYYRHSGARAMRRFEAVPSAAVRRLALGPRGTLAAGYAHGELRLWHLDELRPLAEAKLHGAIEQLLVSGRWLLATSELGRHWRLDLGIFELDYCRLLERVRATIPLVWRDGMLKRATPQQRRCVSGRATDAQGRTMQR
jgi:WD40 repeat protein/serine/threonine protein kinase